MPSENDVRKVLQTVKYPGFNRDIISFGLLKAVAITNDNVRIELSITTKDTRVSEQIQIESQHAIQTLPGVHCVEVNINHQTSTNTRLNGPTAIKGVQHVVAIASGKGGVGKSTVAANIAIALRRTGARVGLCDCDIYGPSIAFMFGSKEPPCVDNQNRIVPVERYGIKLMSMGFLLDDAMPAILRGPIVTRYTQQFLRQVHWNDLDYLILDLPPGTGDIQLTIVQTVSIAGAIIVTTPQEVALLDARKAASMFVQTQVSILGIVENMSYFLCPGDRKKYEIFGRGGGAKEAHRLGLPLLAEIPIQPDVCITADNGHPITDDMPHSVVAQSFLSLAYQVKRHLEKSATQ